MTPTEKYRSYNLILASGSPRRHQFLKNLDLDFSIQTFDVEEIYPKTLEAHEITDYLAKLKAKPFEAQLLPSDTIVITSDTIVWFEGKALGKPKDKNHAIEILSKLSGNTHDVISSVCLTSSQDQQVAHQYTQVTFRTLTPEEIRYYVHTYEPLDKAGAYGIQEWIGLVGITEIKGSYPNVVGLPTTLLYSMLDSFVST